MFGMKDRPPSSLVYVPPHQRLGSMITAPSQSPPPPPSPANGSSNSDRENQGLRSNPNPNHDSRGSCSPASGSSPSPKRQHSPVRSRVFKESNQHYNIQNSWHYKQMKSNPDCVRKQNNMQVNSTMYSVGESGNPEIKPSEPPATVTSCVSTADILDRWKQKLSVFLSEMDVQELISLEKKDRHEFEGIAAMATRMGLYSQLYSKVIVISKVPLPNYRFDLDEKRPQREVELDTGLERRVHAHLNDHLSRKSTSKGAPQNGTFSGSSSNANIATDDALLELSESVSLNGSINDSTSRRRNMILQNQQLAWQGSTEGRGIQEFRRSLPAFKERDVLLSEISNSQVTIVSGETGCGKTTQIPQYILESEIDCGRGTSCSIICTQPRRISAISVAERVATERGEKLGESVGYKVRLEGMRGRDTRLLFCTSGILLRRLLVDRNLKGITHVIVDEIHERGMNEDFLLIVLKELLPRRPDLKLILMSATLDAELFSSYFKDAPAIHIPGFTYPVQTFFLEDILEMTGYRLTPENQIDDYGQEKAWKMNKQTFRKRKSQIASAVEDALCSADFKEYSSQTHESLSCWNPDSLEFNFIEYLLCGICEHEGPGAVLVFLTGWDDLSSLKEKLQSNAILGDSSRVSLLACHGSMATSEQKLIFEKPQEGIRKIVLATNIAETSITIDDVVYVVDCGKAKETSYDALNNTPCLLPSWISKVSAQQRRGRAGRVQPGECYHLYPRCVYDAFAEYQLPEILRTPLQSLCLQIKSLKLGSISEFLSRALQSPESLAVQNAIEYLKIIGALDENENLTVLGGYLSMLPVEPKLGKVLILGAVLNCLDPVLTVVAGLSTKDPFLTPMDKRDLAEAAKAQFSGDYSDHLALLRAYEGWKGAERDFAGYDFCWKNFLSIQSMKAMDSLRRQFHSLLKDTGLVDDIPPTLAQNSYDEHLIRAVICYGLYPSVCSLVNNDKSFKLKTMEDGQVHLCSQSVNAKELKIPYPWLVFNEKIKVNSVFLRDSTAVSDSILLLFGGSVQTGETDGYLKMLGGYLEFFMKPSTAELYLTLKREFEEFINLKLSHPRIDISSHQHLLSAIKLLVSEDKCEGRFAYGKQAHKTAKPSVMPTALSLPSRTLSGPGGDNSKSNLQTIVTRAGYNPPTYKVKQLPNGQFRATVELNGMQFTGRPCGNKKSAEKDAAAEAVEWIMGGTQTGEEYVSHMSMLQKKSKKSHN